MDKVSGASDTSSTGDGEIPAESSIIVPKKNILIVSSSDVALYRMATLVQTIAGDDEHAFISRSNNSDGSFEEVFIGYCQ